MTAQPPELSYLQVAADASVAERAAFLQRTYTWVLLGILGFCGTLAAWEHVPALQQFSALLFGNWILWLVILMGGSYLVHAVAEKSPINVVAYFAWVFILGVMIAPVVNLANAMSPDIVMQASLITAIVFVGLTAYVFISAKDFSFMGGFLAVGLFGMIGVGIAGWLFGFDVGVWYSVAGALLFAGYILYDTSRILHHYPTTAHIGAAIVLVTDVILLFQHILVILMSSRD